MVPDLPKLSILSLSELLPHEDDDRQRTLPLIERLRSEGILRNPLIVMPLLNGNDHYMVLDGANRLAAFQEMKIPYIVVQVVQPDDPNVALMTWNHVVWGMPVSDLVTYIQDRIGIKLMPLVRNTLEPDLDCLPVKIQLADGPAYLTLTTPNLAAQMTYLHGIVDSYKGHAFFDRTSQSSVESFRGVYAELTALIIFPRFEIRTVLNLTGQGFIMPTGITRIAVSPRALHINYPLPELSSPTTIEYKEARLHNWLQECIQNRNVRYYTEATFLFDD